MTFGDVSTRSYRWLWALLLCVSVSLSLQAAEQETGEKILTIGTYDYLPHVEERSGSLKGKGIDYLRHIVEAAGFKPVFQIVPRKRLAQYLANDEIDLAFPIFEKELLAAKKLSVRPVLFETPGLCFRKENFIPFLSVVDRWKELDIIYAGGTEIIPFLHNNNQQLQPIFGEDIQDRLIKMVASRRADAAYIANAFSVYNVNSRFYHLIACSNFYGHSSPVHIAMSEKLDQGVMEALQISHDRLAHYSEFGVITPQGE